jgi:hypothetical protein
METVVETRDSHTTFGSKFRTLATILPGACVRRGSHARAFAEIAAPLARAEVWETYTNAAMQ